MKKLLSMALIASMTLSLATASANDRKKNNKLTTTCFVTSVECEGCVKKVMNVIPFEKGVKDVDVDLKSQTVTVTYDPKKCNDDKICASFSKIDISAKVQKCCKVEKK